MANRVHSQQKRNLRNHTEKIKEENLSVVSARYTGGFSIAITFSSGRQRLVNFLPLFEKYVHGANLKYFAPERFQKFIVKNGNIYWGRNEDVIFPVQQLLKGPATRSAPDDEILYII